MAVIALLIKLDSPGPVVYRRRVMGLNGRQFDALKFRTMHIDGDAILAASPILLDILASTHKIKDDPRITSIGRFLRRTSIDEMPQLWNVLTGDMSLVGPRPLPCDESAACHAWQKDRLRVKPGLTCIWQVTGRSHVNFDDWMRMDLNYVQNASFTKDLKILAATVPAVMFGEGAY